METASIDGIDDEKNVGSVISQFGGHLSNHHLSHLMVFKHWYPRSKFQISSVRSGLYEVEKNVWNPKQKKKRNRFDSKHEAGQKKTENWLFFGSSVIYQFHLAIDMLMQITTNKIITIIIEKRKSDNSEFFAGPT